MSGAERVTLATSVRRGPVRRVGLLLALLLVWPAGGFAQGQDAGAEAYEVQRGDTLWGLAEQYLASGRRWQDIYALNRSTVRDPDLIFPGQVLTLPSAAVAAGAERPDPWPQEDPRPAPSFQENPFAGPSVFDRSPERGVTLGRFEVEFSGQEPLVSSSDFYGAPFIATAAKLDPIATTVRMVGQNPLNLRLPATIPLNRQVVLLLRGLRVQAGQELLAFKWKRRVRPHGNIAEPVAMLTVLEAGTDSARARVRQVFGAYEVGDPVILPSAYPASPPVALQMEESGITGRVLGFATKHPLLGLSDAAFLDVGAAHGVELGDEFAAFSTDVLDPGSASLTDALALLRVVRVREQTATAVLVKLRDVGTAAGSPVRLVAQAVPSGP